MKPKKLLTAAALLLAFGPPSVRPQAAPPKPQKASGKTQPTAGAPAPDWQELIRRAQESADAAQAEARRARERGEQLQRRLDEQARELAALRETVAELRQARTASVARAVNPESSTAPPAASSAPNSELSTPNPERRTPNAEDRLARLEEQSQVNAAQIKEHAQTKVESDARFRVKLYGTVLVNAYVNTNDTGQNAAPQYAPPPGWAGGYGTRHAGATLRQTTLGLLMDGARLGEKLGRARVSAETEFDFYGGSAGDYGSVLGHLRLRTASLRLDWERASIVAGLREPLISPRNPSSLAAVYYPALAEAGNLWQWRPQFIVERRVRAGEEGEVALQGGVMMPFGETVDGAPSESVPAYEARAAYSRSVGGERELAFGVGGHFGRRDLLFGRRVNSYAVTADWLVPLGGRFELSGEAFFGRAMTLSEQSGANVGRHFALSGSVYRPATTVRGVHAFGGWAQLSYRARDDLDFNFAWGREDPRNRDLRDGVQAVTSLTPRFRNETLMANFIYRLRSNVLVSLEHRRLWTDYAARRQTNGHYNVAVGYTF
jgi:hypothetical protein